MGIEHISRIISSHCAEQPDILCSYLFGSMARGSEKDVSDIDIAVLLDGSVPSPHYTDRAIDLSVSLGKRLSKEVDVVILNRTSTYLKFRVIREGIKIFDRRKETDRRFEARSIQEYFDYLPVRKNMEEKLLERIKERSNGR